MIPTERAHIHVAASSHPGVRGKNNEDRYAVSAYRVSADDPTPSIVAVVSDGIGGHRAGEVAAEIAVETISRTVAESDASQPTTVLSQAISRASQAIRTQAERDSSRKGMGATCVCVWVIGNRLFTASVGDSRLYLIRGISIQQLTTDHTWVQEAIDYGALTPEQARNHPNVHVIRRYLGSQPTATPDFRLRLQSGESNEQAETNQGMSLLPGDCLVMCSDGLTDLVEKDEILTAYKALSREDALQRLTNLANQRGGHDNITIVALEIPGGAQTSRQVEAKSSGQKNRQRQIVLACLGISALLLVFASLGGGLAWYFTRHTPTPPTPTLVLVLSSTPRLTLTPTVTLTSLPSTTPTVTSLPSSTPTVTSSTPRATLPPRPTKVGQIKPSLAVTANPSLALKP